MKITERYQYPEANTPVLIQEAYYIGDFAIRLRFSDGYQKLVDFKPFLEKSTHPAIKKYLQESLFQNFQIKSGNLDWNDFDLCFSIEDLYRNDLLREFVIAGKS
ncbi:MAG: DUF2442 domain-containing protein [Bacteroidia bacterium]